MSAGILRKIVHDPVAALSLARDLSAALIALGAAFVAWRRRQSARHWPMVSGTAELGRNEGGKPGVTLCYSYRTNRGTSSGQQVMPARGNAEGDARR